MRSHRLPPLLLGLVALAMIGMSVDRASADPAARNKWVRSDNGITWARTGKGPEWTKTGPSTQDQSMREVYRDETKVILVDTKNPNYVDILWNKHADTLTSQLKAHIVDQEGGWK